MAKILPRNTYQTSASIEETEISKRTLVLKDNIEKLIQSIPDAHALYEDDYRKFKMYLNRNLKHFDKLLVTAVEMKSALLDLESEELNNSPNVNYPIGYLNDTHENSFFQKNIVGRYRAIYYNLIYKTYLLGLDLVNKAINSFLENLDEIAIQEVYYNFNIYTDSGSSDPREKMLTRTNIMNFNWFAAEIVQDFIINEYDKDTVLQIFKVDDRKGIRNQFLKGNPVTELLLYHPNYGGLFTTSVGGNTLTKEPISGDPVFQYLTKGNYSFLSQFIEIKTYYDSDELDSNFKSYIKNKIELPAINNLNPSENYFFTKDNRLLIRGNSNLIEFDFKTNSIKELYDYQVNIPSEEDFTSSYLQENNIWIEQ